jgi:hypothetical protein
VKPLSFRLHAAGALAPGLESLAQLRRFARGEEAHAAQPLVLPAPAQLPANERRRASQVVRLTLACIQQALADLPVPAAGLRSVFASDEGTGEVCQQMLEALATTGQVSPLLFTNSVHNAPSGYFSIAARNEQPATVVSLGMESFASGLLCAVADAAATGQPVLLVACDPAMTAPLDEWLPVVEATCAAFVLSASGADVPGDPMAVFRLELQPTAVAPPSPLPRWMPPAWSGNSSARALACLDMLEQPPGTVMRLALGGQSLALWREGAAA